MNIKQTITLLAKRLITNNIGSTNTIISIAVGLLVLAFIVPMSLEQFFAVSTTNWTSSVVTMWNLIPVVAMLGLVLLFIFWAIKRKGD